MPFSCLAPVHIFPDHEQESTTVFIYSYVSRLSVDIQTKADNVDVFTSPELFASVRCADRHSAKAHRIMLTEDESFWLTDPRLGS